MEMEMEIVSATSEFDFKTITLADPHPLAGHAGFYFTPLSIGSGDKKKSLCLQLPTCITKQGIVNVKNAKYLDLMFERAEHDKLMQWVEKLEYNCQDSIDAKKDLWFQTDLTRDDIETMMTQVIRLYQSGKYMLMRVFIEMNKASQKCIAYDENEIGFDLDTLDNETKIIPLVMIEGVKFSSRSFEISVKLLQVMVIDKKNKKSSCLIKRPGGSISGASISGASISGASISGASISGVSPLPLVKASPLEAAPLEAAPLEVAPLETVSLEAVPLEALPVEALPVEAAPIEEAPIEVAPLVKKNPNNFIKHDIPKMTPLVNISNGLEEIDIDYNNVSDSINLKNPNDVYYEIYRTAREKAKQYRLQAIEAYLEAKQIKSKYMLNEIDDDDSDDSFE